ncbi:hypothetical protein [Arthrobacter sp. RIT-PI-e]|uniref:hypothetical protein n=1 Tax=Arthrobacter sp. RIT-PI-e TaxID=1681197 RepID=UPI00128F7A34|nr:hypothetical protein [Arthrobacter sp. RIT-PI-e]
MSTDGDGDDEGDGVGDDDVVADGVGGGVTVFATAGTALPMRPTDSNAAQRRRAGEGRFTGFSSRIRASAS